MSPSQPRPVASSTATATGRVPFWVVALGLTVFAAAAWLAFLGWDHEYYEVDGEVHGPYRAWQVLACGASIVAATVVAHLLTRPHPAHLVLAVAATLGLAVPWSVDAAAHDDSGLWVVGLVLLLVGAGTGLTVLLALCAHLPTRRTGTDDGISR